MLGISEIQKLTALYTDNEVLQQQLMKDLTSLSEDIESAQRNSFIQSSKSEDLLVDANICDRLNERCGEQIVDVDNARKSYNASVEQKCEEDCESTKRSALDSKIHLQKFVDESGMCGMGMGMGSSYSEEGAIDLTVEELMALQSSLLVLSEGNTDTFDSNFAEVEKALNDKFQENGTSSKASVGSENGTQYIEISRANGENVRIYDANGNGALDTKDYDFCQAISKACEIISQMESTICGIKADAASKIEASNDAADRTIANLQNQQSMLQEQADADRLEASRRQAIADDYTAEAHDLEQKYDDTTSDLLSVQTTLSRTAEAIEEAKAEEKAEAVAEGEGEGEGETVEEGVTPNETPVVVAEEPETPAVVAAAEPENDGLVEPEEDEDVVIV